MLTQNKTAVLKLAAEVKVINLSIYLEVLNIANFRRNNVAHYKNLLQKTRYINNQLQKKLSLADF